jgi:hypothetical protein
MTEIFPIYDAPVPGSGKGGFVLFFKAFPQAEDLEKQRTVPT